jgi:hypothetical protein
MGKTLAAPPPTLPTCAHTQATVGATSIDPRALLLRQNVELTNVPVGTLKVVFDAADFGHFLVHPLMNTAVATAVQVRHAKWWRVCATCHCNRDGCQPTHRLCITLLPGRYRCCTHTYPHATQHNTSLHACAQGHAFVFDPQTVRITAPTPAMPGGEIEFCGTWRRDGGRYRVQLTPVQQGAAVGRGVQAHAVPLSTGGRGSAWGCGCVQTPSHGLHVGSVRQHTVHALLSCLCCVSACFHAQAVRASLRTAWAASSHASAWTCRGHSSPSTASPSSLRQGAPTWLCCVGSAQLHAPA